MVKKVLLQRQSNFFQINFRHLPCSSRYKLYPSPTKNQKKKKKKHLPSPSPHPQPLAVAVAPLEQASRVLSAAAKLQPPHIATTTVGWLVGKVISSHSIVATIKFILKLIHISYNIRNIFLIPRVRFYLITFFCFL